MKILIITIGSRGDIQPFVALGQYLQKQGYEVALQTAKSYQTFVETHELRYVYMNDDFIKLSESKAGQAATEGGGKLQLMKQVMPMLASMLQDEWRGAQDFRPDLIIYHPKSLGASHIAEKLNIPLVMSLPLPLYTPTHEFPLPIMAGIRLGGFVNRLTYSVMQLATAPYMGVINDFRVNILGLSKRGRFANDLIQANGQPIPIVYAYSPSVLPRPVDYPKHVHVTGYWFLEDDPDWQPSSALTDFINNGTPPIYIGFGSMSGTQAETRAQTVIQAVQQTGQRAILASGWGGLKASNLPDNMMMIDQAPHHWLFPKMSAIIHHGGAGTTAATLRAGKPSLIVPFIVDQPFWGDIVHRLGVGAKPIPQGRLTSDNLANAIQTLMSDVAMRQKAQDLGTKIRAENGLHNTLDVLKNLTKKS
jgi:sterol 3beta-glucosyltransferase